MQIVSRLFASIFLKTPFYLLYVFVPALVSALFKLPDEEALQMLNISFPVKGIIAGIAFSWAQCMLYENSRPYSGPAGFDNPAGIPYRAFGHGILLRGITCDQQAYLEKELKRYALY